jgi:putative GTP pyrophosphokinase
MPIRHDAKELKKAGLTEADLQLIRKDFIHKIPDYEQTAQYVTNVLLKTSGVHSVRYRVKNPDHLTKKILRKKLDNKQRILTVASYEEEITDLAGIRVLHLFKNDWQDIHKFIINTWELKETPIVYYRKGDSTAFLKMFEGCETKEHPYGYRSVHYIIETSPTKSKRYVELQVRTIFEEGWSEIDHKIRYPNFSDNPLTNNLLMIPCW